MRDLLLGLGMVGVGYMMMKPSTTHEAETFHSFQPTQAVTKVDLDKWVRLWDFIANDKVDPSFLQVLAPYTKSYESGVYTYNLRNSDAADPALENVSWEYNHWSEKWDGRPLVNLCVVNNYTPLGVFLGYDSGIGYNGNTMGVKLSNTWSFEREGRWQHGSHMARRWDKPHLGMEYCCPTNPSFNNNETQEEHQAIQDIVNEGLTAYRKYLDSNGNLQTTLSINSEASIEGFGEDMEKIKRAYWIWQDLCGVLFFHQIMKRFTQSHGGSIFEIGGRHGPADYRHRTHYPELYGYYYVEGVLGKDYLTTFLEAFPKKYHRFIKQHHAEYTLPESNGEYTLWCDFLQQQYDALKEIDFGRITSLHYEAVNKTAYYENNLSGVEEDLQDEKSSIRKWRKELKDAKHIDERIKKEIEELKKAHKEQIAQLRKELKEELKDHKEDLEYEVENIKEHNPDYIKSAQVKVKALDGEIKEMKEHLKDGNKNASAKYGGTVVVNPKEVAEHRWSIHDISDW
jgi:hypothetical protein